MGDAAAVTVWHGRYVEKEENKILGVEKGGSQCPLYLTT
jgi:hypothetical protein